MARTYSESWQKFEESIGARPVLSGSPDAMRAQYKGLGDALEQHWPSIPDSVSITDEQLGDLKLRIFKPSASAEHEMPVAVYYHGGGLVIPLAKSDDVLCATLVHATKIIIVSVDYRLSPEHKAPAHLQDAVESFKWAFENASRLGGDPKKIFAFGSSSGGGLALATARKIKLSQTGLAPDTVKGIVALTPVTIHPEAVSQREEHQSMQENEKGVPLVDKAAMLTFHEAAGLDAGDKDYFVLLDRDAHRLFPPTYLATCEFDPLRDDGIVLAEDLKSAGVPVRRDHYEGMPHVFFNVPVLPEMSGSFIENTVNGIKWILTQL